MNNKYYWVKFKKLPNSTSVYLIFVPVSCLYKLGKEAIYDLYRPKGDTGVKPEYLDMIPEDCRLTAIDNVFLLRHARRLPFGKRNVPGEVERFHKSHPIDPEIVWLFVQEIQNFIDVVWYDPNQVLERGTFV